ncbi:MAG: hypothetical protein N2316_10535 [Spirochaetes bacterium]|nr:hypothetical protein [Spirochaetota bacterium]
MRNRALLAVLIISAMQCKSVFSPKDRFEGMSDGTFRVYVRIPIDDESDDFDKIVSSKLFEKASERLAVFISSGMISKNMFESTEPKIVYKRCYDDFCEAFIDYPIRRGEQK